jgi:hypothetical protein
MSGKADFDLTGRWTGIFNYPAFHPPNSFEAVLRDVGGGIGGTITEADDDPGARGRILHAVVEGHRSGSAVRFTKMYDDLDRMPDPVFYSGTVQPDGNEISGRWEIAGSWAGTFLMIRNAGSEEAAERQAGESVGS